MRPGIAAGLAVLWMWLGAAAPVRAAEWGEIRDPDFGHVLYLYFQGRYLDALTHLAASERLGRILHHPAEAQMLRGSLYLAWGMEAEASRIFAGLLDTRADPAIRDQAWFHIARLRYRHGRHAEAAAALARIGDALPARLAPERAYLQAQLALGQAPADPALADARLDPDDPWAVYARYNLGVVLLREGQDAAGEAALARVAGLRTASSELQALADRARIALAYHHLRREDPERAGQALLGVRLHGPMADRALLALGWARARQERFDLALVPWTELAGRDVLEPAVQEGLLARPWALARLGDEAGAR